VRECCFPHDALVILSIKIPPRPVDDFVAWSGEHNGLFSVRSAYRIGMQPKLVELSGGQSSSDPTGDRKVWDLIWKLNVPPKLRIFAWRAASDSLGVRLNLSRRIHTITPICTICGHAPEDAHNALVSCTLARALREELHMHWSLPDEMAFRGSNKEWLFSLLGNAPKDQRPMIIFLLWRAWHHRNNIVHGDGKASVSASVPYLINYHRSFTCEEPKIGIVPTWRAPAIGAVKAYVDAGWDSTTKCAGIGIIIRDHLGSPFWLNGGSFRPVGVRRKPRSWRVWRDCDS
jgi:hypothetical protein